MGYEVNYASLPAGEERDTAAINDIRGYLGDERFARVEEEAKRLEELGTSTACNKMNFLLGFAGISGMPFHAFCRKYLPTAYAAWMADDTY